MLQKVLSAVTAVSSTITAVFCIWFAANMVHCSNEAGKAATEIDRSMVETDSRPVRSREFLRNLEAGRKEADRLRKESERIKREGAARQSVTDLPPPSR